MQEGLVIRKFKLKDWKKVKRLYKNSFPKNERYLFILLYFNILRKNSNMFLLEEKSKIVGFIHLIYYKNMVFILYLAIDKEKRSRAFWETFTFRLIMSLITLIFYGIYIYFVNENQIIFIILAINLINIIFEISLFFQVMEEFQ